MNMEGPDYHLGQKLLASVGWRAKAYEDRTVIREIIASRILS